MARLLIWNSIIIRGKCCEEGGQGLGNERRRISAVAAACVRIFLQILQVSRVRGKFGV